MKPNKQILILLLIILAALSVRLVLVSVGESYWFDEVVSLEIAKKGIAGSWQYLRWENNPPLHYWWLAGWIKLFGESEIAVRMSSVLLGVLGVLAVYFLGKEIKGKQVGLYAAGLAAASSYLLYLAADARMYSMLFLFGVGSYYFYLKIIKKSAKKIDWCLYALMTVLALYTHITGLFLCLVQNLFFILNYWSDKQNRVKVKPWVYSQIIIIGAFFPWLWLFLTRVASVLNQNAWYFHTSGGGFYLAEMPRSFLLAGNEAIPILELIGLILFGWIFVRSFTRVLSWSSLEQELKLKFTITKEVVFLLFVFLVPLTVGFILQIWVNKYFILSSIGLYLILAVGFHQWKIKPEYRVVALAMIFVIFLPYNLFILSFAGHHQWDKVAEYIEAREQPGDMIIIAAFVYQIPFNYYYEGKLAAVGYGPDWMAGDVLLNAVKYNWYPTLTEDNMPDIGQMVEGYDRAMVVNPTVSAPVHRASLVIDWFYEHGWRLESMEQFGGFVQPQVLIFEAPAV